MTTGDIVGLYITGTVIWLCGCAVIQISDGGRNNVIPKKPLAMCVTWFPVWPIILVVALVVWWVNCAVYAILGDE